MTTAAAIDRLVHHATIIEMVGKSVRAEEAAKRSGTGSRRKKRGDSAPTTTTSSHVGEM